MTSKSGHSAEVSIPEALSHSAGYLLNRTARIIREMITEALSPLHLTPRELGILRVIDAEGPLSQQSLGKKHNIDRTSTVELIDSLEARDLVVRTSNADDRRSYQLFLTPKGKKTLAKAARMAEKKQASFLEALTESEWNTLRQLLIKLLTYHQSK